MTRAPPSIKKDDLFCNNTTCANIHGIMAASLGKPAYVNFTGAGATTA
ncbi:MAG: hypothetical protein PHN69_02750 [Candidatus Pacebacteria bacterium]|nr:hypothetical protein [Candidatus Paceibacterota bacterium]